MLERSEHARGMAAALTDRRPPVTLASSRQSRCFGVLGRDCILGSFVLLSKAAARL